MWPQLPPGWQDRAYPRGPTRIIRPPGRFAKRLFGGAAARGHALPWTLGLGRLRLALDRPVTYDGLAVLGGALAVP